MDKARAHRKRGGAVLAAKPGDMEGEEGTSSSNGDMADCKVPAGILDDAVRTAAERAASGLFGIREEDFNGVRMVDDLVDRDLRWKLDEFVGDLSSHNCLPAKILFLG